MDDAHEPGRLPCIHMRARISAPLHVKDTARKAHRSTAAMLAYTSCLLSSVVAEDSQ
jgi:hypothetical protein